MEYIGMLPKARGTQGAIKQSTFYQQKKPQIKNTKRHHIPTQKPVRRNLIQFDTHTWFYFVRPSHYYPDVIQHNL